jgi:hypothetical protein
MADAESAMEACPECGHDEYYHRVRFSGVGKVIIRFDGYSADNSEMHDNCKYTMFKTAYCAACETKLKVPAND